MNLAGETRKNFSEFGVKLGGVKLGVNLETPPG
jgi:hypothetical protein